MLQVRINMNLSELTPEEQEIIERHREENRPKKPISDRERYLTTYNGDKLLKKYDLQKYAIWSIYGEDPNCDLGGAHHTPLLATLEGKLDDVINEAVKTKGFWAWGAGGEIKEIEIKKLKIKKVPQE